MATGPVRTGPSEAGSTGAAPLAAGPVARKGDQAVATRCHYRSSCSERGSGARARRVWRTWRRAIHRSGFTPGAGSLHWSARRRGSKERSWTRVLRGRWVASGRATYRPIRSNSCASSRGSISPARPPRRSYYSARRECGHSCTSDPYGRRARGAYSHNSASGYRSPTHLGS